MTKYKHFRSTCFLCRYELTKHNRSENKIKFAGKMKPICKYCTKNKHKVLDNRYKNIDIDIQCKKCNKPSKYKNCIMCSMCNHAFHGKCLKLSKNDIEKIDNVNNFFICIDCNNEILPQQFDAVLTKHKSKPKNKTNHKQCLTCNNVVTKKSTLISISYIMNKNICFVKNAVN